MYLSLALSLWISIHYGWICAVGASNVTFQERFDLQDRGYKGSGGHEMYWVAEKDSGGGDLLKLFLLGITGCLAAAAILMPTGASLITSMMAMMQAMNGNGAATAANGARQIDHFQNIHPELLTEILKLWHEVESAVSKGNQYL